MSEIQAFDVITAANNPIFIKDAFFSKSKVITLPNGRIDSHGGGFSQVFPIVKDGKKWAFKVWYKEIDENKKRYDIISSYLNKCKLKYFVDFTYVENGILVKGEYLDTCRMEWVDGDKLTQYIAANLEHPILLKKLAQSFLVMTKKLRQNFISHGDLQHENIIVKENGQLVLIDYDSLCVPGLSGRTDICRGRLGFQHPARFTDSEWLASIKIDYFSELIIYLSICSLLENKLLWDKHKVDQADRLLFSHNDFIDFENSEIRKDLLNLSPKVKSLVIQLENYLAPHRNLIPFNLTPFKRFSIAFSSWIKPSKLI